jgi:hypothetical protein
MSVFPIQMGNSHKTYVILTAIPIVAGHVEDLIIEGWDL